MDPAPRDSDAEQEPDYQSAGVIPAMWRYRWMCLAIVAICVLLSAAVGTLLTPGAEATATIALKTPRQNNVLSPGSQGDASLARYTAQRARFVTSDAVLGSVATTLNRSDVTKLRDEVEATPSGDSNVVTVTVKAGSGPKAVALAKAVSKAYSAESAKQVAALTDAAIASIQQSSQEVRSTAASQPGSTAITTAAASSLSQLQLQASEIKTNSALLGDGIEFVIEPREDSVVESGLPIREAGLGFVVGLAIAATASWLRADRSRSVRPDATVQ